VIKDISDINKSEPYLKFLETYNKALEANQKNTEAIVISTYDETNKETDCRIVNLKYIIDEEWIFFSNYNSPKAKQILTCNKISCLLFWPKINTQIRLKSKIKKTSVKISDSHFSARNKEKNAIAISSNQSEYISSYKKVINNFNDSLKNHDCKTRPDYWGGFSFFPYYFEFWVGHEKRLNHREVYEKKGSNWVSYNVQP